MVSFLDMEFTMALVCPSAAILDHFSALSDPRQGWRVMYPLQEILLLVRRYYLASSKLSAKALAHAARAHWGIENHLHWVLDVVFHDDLARLRSSHGPHNMAIVKHIAMNLLRSPKDKHSLSINQPGMAQCVMAHKKG